MTVVGGRLLPLPLRAAIAERDQRLRRRLFGKIGGSIAAVLSVSGVLGVSALPKDERPAAEEA